MSNRGAPRPPAPPRTRLNGAIRVREVRLIGEDGAQLGVMLTQDAMQRALDLGLDLVEVQATAEPPVCRLMDYGRHRYEQDRKERESKRNTKPTELKEVRLKPDTDSHDLETKSRAIRKWISEGSKVQLTVRMRGREQAHPEVARKVLSDLAASLSDVSFIERNVIPEGRTMTLMLAPGAAPARRAVGPAGPPAAAPAPEQPQA